MTTKIDDIYEVSPAAGVIVALEIVHRILSQLVNRGIMTEAELHDLFSEAANVERQAGVSYQPNLEAARVLSEMAKAAGKKWVRMPMIRG
jgi:hypothetical protein